MPAYVFVPADLERAKIDHALAYGATVVPIDGTYDDVNRLCLQIADETGWGFVNINLRPFYAEGSKTLAFEIAESLGWRLAGRHRRADRVGGDVHQAGEGLRELADAGLIERAPIRFVGGQAAGCAPVATAWAAGRGGRSPSATPDTFVRSLAIGNPADGRYSVELARASGGSVEAIPDETTAAAIRQTRHAGGHLHRDRRRRDVAAAAAARRRGVIRDGDEVVALLTGNGLKTPDARHARAGRRRGARPGRPGLAPVIGPSLTAFEAWLEEPHERGSDSARRCAPRPAGAKIVEWPADRPRGRRRPRDDLPGAGARSSSTATASSTAFVNVFLNDTDVRHLGGLDTPVGDRDSVVLLPAMAGG